jgi:hypothetical protein
VPITLEYHHAGFNLVRFDGWVYALPQATGPGFDLRQQPAQRLELLPRGRNLAAVKHRVAITSALFGGDTFAMAADLARQLAGEAPARGGLRGLLRGAARLLR